MLARAGRLVAYLLSFAVGRGALFVAPLVLANLLPAESYGDIEMAYAVATVAVAVCTLGTGSVVPLALLGHNTRATMHGIVFHHLVVVLASIGAFAAARFAGAPAGWQLAALFAVGIALQSLGSVHLRTLGRGNSSLFLEAGLFVFMAIAAVLAIAVQSRTAMAWVTSSALGYSAALIVVYGWVLLQLRRNEELEWRSAVASGAPLMMGSFVSVLATTSGRLGMGLLAGPVLTADYSVLARAGALPIVAHQLVVVATFRALFTLSHHGVERLTVRIVSLVALSAGAFWAVMPWIRALLGPAFASSWDSGQQSGPLIIAQAILWSAIALNDLVISRQQIMRQVLPIAAAGLGIALLVGLLALSNVGIALASFVWVHSFVMLAYYLIQSGAMAWNGARLWRTWLTATGSYLLFVLIVCLWGR